MKQSKFLSLKEFVIVLLLACVETAIGLVVTMPFAANLQLVYFLAPGLPGCSTELSMSLSSKSAQR